VFDTLLLVKLNTKMIRAEFDNLQSYLRKTFESEDKIAVWEQNPQNQKAQTLVWVLEDPSIQQSVKILQAEAPRSIVRDQQMELG
jgi:hypothetical protein